MENKIIDLSMANSQDKDDISDKRLSQLKVLYDMMERLKRKGKIASTYGCEDDFADEDGSVLSDFMEYICQYYEMLDMVEWLEAFYQVLCWQFQSMHEGVTTYYENFYGVSEYMSILKTSEFMQKNEYLDIYVQYSKGIVLCENECEYPENVKMVAQEIDDWINWHTREVWEFCVDILEKHRDEWKCKS